MNKKRLAALVLFCAFSAPISHACPTGMTTVHDEARLSLLKFGAFIEFKQKIEIPSFETELGLSDELRLYIDPSAVPRFISEGRAFPVVKSEQGHIRMPDTELILSMRRYSPTVGDLVRAAGGALSVCQKIVSPREII